MGEFLSTNLSIIICIVVGLGLLAVEGIMPGFGVAGVAGIAFILCGTLITWSTVGPLAATFVFLCSALIGTIIVTVFIRAMAKGKLQSTPFVLKSTSVSDDTIAPSIDVGAVGVAESIMRPAGIASFGGERVNVVTRGGYINKGDAIVVERVEGSRIVVKAKG